MCSAPGPSVRLFHLAVLGSALFLALAVVVYPAQPGVIGPVAVQRAEVVREIPRAPVFTQGLVFGSDGYLYESTGLYGVSSLRRLHPDDGRVIVERRLSPELFGEGLAFHRGRLIQLTWHAGRALVYRPADLAVQGEYRYRGEGWGLCAMPDVLVLSDGSSALQLRDPRSFALVGRVEVTAGGVPVPGLNELECVGGHVYANRWRTPFVVRVLLSTGEVDVVLDLSSLFPGSFPPGWGVANGVAYHPRRNTLYVTGKNWTRLYEIRLPVF